MCCLCLSKPGKCLTHSRQTVRHRKEKTDSQSKATHLHQKSASREPFFVPFFTPASCALIVTTSGLPDSREEVPQLFQGPQERCLPNDVCPDHESGAAGGRRETTHTRDFGREQQMQSCFPFLVLGPLVPTPLPAIIHQSLEMMDRACYFVTASVFNHPDPEKSDPLFPFPLTVCLSAALEAWHSQL